jgi:ketosteroid isomerase-like protein
MAMNVREACEKGTETFNAHDVDGSADVLADDVVFQAPGGMSGQGKAACLEFYGSWFVAFPTPTSRSTTFTSSTTPTSSRARSPELTTASSTARHATSQPLAARVATCCTSKAAPVERERGDDLSAG